MRITRVWLCIAMLGVLNGCATLNESECRTTNWRDLGERDGRNGREPNTRLGQHAESCSKYGVSPNQGQYYAGWQQGVPFYCAPENAYAVGRRGDSYEGVCPGDADRVFRMNYGNGKRVYDVTQKINSLGYDIKTRENKLVNNKELKQEERAVLYEQIKRLGTELSLERVRLIEAERLPIVK